MADGEGDLVDVGFGLGEGDFVLDPEGDGDGVGLSFGSVSQMTVGEGR